MDIHEFGKILYEEYKEISLQNAVKQTQFGTPEHSVDYHEGFKNGFQQGVMVREEEKYEWILKRIQQVEKNKMDEKR